MTSNLIFSTTLLLSLALLTNVNAQGTYSTTKGSIQITTVLNGEPLIAKSNSLSVILNYETAQFELRLDKSTLRTGIDTLDERLESLQGTFLIYEGRLGIDYVQTKSHPPLDFIVEGYLTCSPHYEHLTGQGRLEHIFDGVYSCILNMNFHLNLEELMIDIGLPNLSDELHMEIVQTVLKNEYE